ncbi:5944_t:CDS:2 [Funneliformis geosporum]|nr:5944_t:CDS:2 [Funneliformis geosporum]
MSSDIRTPIYQEKIGISIKEVYSFTPIARDAFSSVLVGNALYFFGGQPYTISNETFYLDVSQSFNSENPPWIETPSAAIPFGSIFATVSSTIVNNNPSIYLFGGFMFDPVSLIDSFISFVYTFDPQTFKWDIPQTKGQIPTRRRDIEAVNDSSGKIYIFGGSNDFARPFTYFNDMIIFDTNILTWSYGTTFNAPKSLFAYTATLLSNGVIVYIGGIDLNLRTANINEINLYDTKLDSWKVMIAKNINTVESRYSHTAVLAPNDQIIICGGAGVFERVLVAPNIAVLTTQSTSFEWTIPQISSNIEEIPTLARHKATLVENYMIVAFGIITQIDKASTKGGNSKLYLLDIRNYTWINKFEHLEQKPKPNPTKSQIPSNSPNSYNSPNSSKDLTTTKIVISVISSIVGTTFLIGIGMLLYRLYKKGKEKQTLRISGNLGSEYNGNYN